MVDFLWLVNSETRASDYTMINERGAVVVISIFNRNRIPQRKPAPVPLSPPQIPHDLTWDRTRSSAIGNWPLTAEIWHDPNVYICRYHVRAHFCVHPLVDTSMRLCHLLARCFAELFYDPEDGGNTFLGNVGYHSTHYTAAYPRRRYSSKPPL
jgi:hypothetical protein